MAKYIPKDSAVAEIEKMRNQEVQWIERQGYTDYHQGLRDGYNRILSLLDTFEVKEDAGHYELKEFAKIIRGNLGGISKNVQSLFEAKYLQLTGNKMYGGYND